MQWSKILLAALSAATMLALAVGTASANRLSLSESEFDLRWTALRFSDNVFGGFVSCPLTLLGRFHSRTITKTRGLLIGYIDHARVGARGGSAENCTGGALTILTATLPWHVRYRSFTGTLPRITTVSLDLIGVALRIDNSGSVCLTRSDAAEPTTGTITLNESGTATGLNPSGSIVADDPGCALFGITLSYVGSAVVENRRGGTLAVRLI
jgi:hypothetical protein